MSISNARRQIQSQNGIESQVTNEPWLHGAVLTGWSHTYEPVRPGPFRGSITAAWLGPIQIGYERIENPINYYGHPWPGSRLFFSYLNDGGTMFYDSRPLSAGVLATQRWSAVERVACGRPFELAVLSVDEMLLVEHAARLYQEEIFPREGAPIVLDADPASAACFQRVVLQTLHDIAAQPELLRNEHATCALQQNLLSAVVEAAVTRPQIQKRLPPPSTRAYIVDRAVSFMSSRLSEPISIADVCADVRVCPRTLGYSFAEILGVSPARYLLATRLSRVRRDLVSNNSVSSIQSVAARWGFWHMGRFAQHYRNAYRERPSETYHLARVGHSVRAVSPPLRSPRPQFSASSPL
jgi:AraC family ethanolamine operon transcriptional activator